MIYRRKITPVMPQFGRTDLHFSYKSNALINVNNNDTEITTSMHEVIDFNATKYE